MSWAPLPRMAVGCVRVFDAEERQNRHSEGRGVPHRRDTSLAVPSPCEIYAPNEGNVDPPPRFVESFQFTDRSGPATPDDVDAVGSEHGHVVVRHSDEFAFGIVRLEAGIPSREVEQRIRVAVVVDVLDVTARVCRRSPLERRLGVAAGRRPPLPGRDGALHGVPRLAADDDVVAEPSPRRPPSDSTYFSMARPEFSLSTAWETVTTSRSRTATSAASARARLPE